MLLIVFGILTFVSLIIVALGFFVDIPVYSTIGFFFLFLLGLALQGGGVTASNTTNETYSYVCGCCQNNTFVTTSLSVCSGTPFLCDHYDLNQVDCEGAGCVYNDTSMLCSGTPTLCEDLPVRDCDLYGCQETTTTNCVNGTEPVLDKIVKNSNEEPLNDQTTVWIGRFLSIASALAMTLVLTQWKKGNVRK